MNTEVDEIVKRYQKRKTAAIAAKHP